MVFNIAYEAITQPIKYIALNHVESNYPSTKREKDPAKEIQKRVRQVGIAKASHDLAELALVVCVAAPIAEELIFRGAIWSGVAWITGSEKLGVITSTALFALVHYTNNKNPLDVAFQLADCYFLYNPARASGGLLSSMAAHIFHNLSCLTPICINALYQKEDHEN